MSLESSEAIAPKLSVPHDTTLFHVTHWKAGSQWIRGILADAFGESLVTGDYLAAEGLGSRIEEGKVYTGAYLAKPELESMSLPPKVRRVVLIRDLRDTLVSGYFSIRYTHGLNPGIRNWRRVLNNLDEEAGLLYLMEAWLKGSVIIQRSWLESGENCFKLEEFMIQPVNEMARVFNAWGITAENSWLRELMERHSFEKYSGGRRTGQEDTTSHYRKGVHGDWRCHFTPKVTAQFKKLYGDLVILGGYENNENW